MNHGVEKQLSTLLERYPELVPIRDSLCDSFDILKDSFENHGKLLVAGNGGSAADSEHIVGELMKSFILPRTIEE